MPRLQRLGDPNSEQGIITSIPQGSVYANGLLVSVNGSLVSPHRPFVEPHLTARTASGSSTVSVNGIPVNRLGDPDTCSHPRVDGSTNVFAGG